MDITAKIWITLVVVMILVLAKLVWDRKKSREKMQNYLKRSWGQPARTEYSADQSDAIHSYYEAHREDWDVDDITWNDLDMERVFQRLNHTRTSAGEEYLYALLRKPLIQREELEERERLVSCLSEQESERMELQMALTEIGKLERMSVYRHLEEVRELPNGDRWKHIAAALLLLISILLCLVKPDIMVIISIPLLAGNIIYYYQSRAKVDSFIRLFSFIIRMVSRCQDVAAVKVSGLEDYQNRLAKNVKCFRKFCHRSFLIAGGNKMGGDILDSLMDYVRMIFHVDLIKIGTMIQEVKKYQTELFELYEIIGYLDSMVSIASYREMLGEYCLPVLENLPEKEICLSFEDIRHPLIENSVSNSLDIRRSVLLTGSNASGKSTFLKTVAINAILAQTIHTVLAENYHSSWYRIYSSMALRDDLMENESYYIVEIKSLKRIMDRVQASEVPVLCFIDEVLRGTNTVERIASSSRILSALAKKGAMCFAATHDIELTYLLEQEYENYHFEEQVTENEVLFDYRLRNGRANTRNAIRLLQMMGYDSELIQEAESAVQQFLTTGSWQ